MSTLIASVSAVYENIYEKIKKGFEKTGGGEVCLNVAAIGKAVKACFKN